MLRKTPLLRKSPLRATSTLRRAPLGARPMPLSSLRATPLRRTRMKRHAPKPRLDADPARLAWVRSLDCCACGKAGPSHPHHRTLSGRGKGQKSADDQTMPLCFDCHRDLHSLTGRFRGFTREMLHAWQVARVELIQGWYARLFAPAEAV